ncbi:MAG: TonB family protein [Gammaproteobacteria bacterium]|nr:TonB family protein [Gammaproteobacteria bacterium]
MKSAIQAAVRFPKDARLLRQEGKVEVSFQLVDGVVTNVKVVAGGRLRSFDVNALNAVREAGIPAPPKALAHQVFTLVLWVKFDLHRSF